MKKRRKARDRSRPLREQGTYFCDACGEQIVVPLDVSAGANQEYVEDCPVCCRPNVIHVEVDEDGMARVWAERE
jgi:transcription elongation factor Elf1